MNDYDYVVLEAATAVSLGQKIVAAVADGAEVIGPPVKDRAAAVHLQIIRRRRENLDKDNRGQPPK